MGLRRISAVPHERVGRLELLFPLLRTEQAGALIQMPVFVLLFLAPVYVPLSLLTGWIHDVARLTQAACECYAVCRDAIDESLGRAVSPSPNGPPA